MAFLEAMIKLIQIDKPKIISSTPLYIYHIWQKNTHLIIYTIYNGQSVTFHHQKNICCWWWSCSTAKKYMIDSYPSGPWWCNWVPCWDPARPTRAHSPPPAVRGSPTHFFVDLNGPYWKSIGKLEEFDQKQSWLGFLTTSNNRQWTIDIPQP